MQTKQRGGVSLSTKHKIKDFILCNYHIIALLLFTITNIYILFNINLMADDSWYKRMADCSLPMMLDFFKWHYANENGRLLAHVFAVLFLKNKVTFIMWKALLAGSLIFYCLLIAKLSAPSYKKGSLTLAVFLYMTVTFGIYATAVYWLTGSFNYFIPTLMLLLLMYVSINKPKSPFIIIWSFFCGATMEQTGIMAIGWFVLITLDCIVKRTKFDIYPILCAISSAVGYATVILAPGTSTRVSNQGFQGFRLMTINLLTVIRKNWIDNISVTVMVFALVICVSYWLYKFRNRSKVSRIITVPVIIYIIAANIINFILNIARFGLGFIGKTFPYSAVLNTVVGILWGIYLLAFLTSAVYVLIRLYIENQAFLPLASSVLGVGSQIVMSASNNAPERTCFPATAMFMIFIIYSAKFIYTDFKKNKKGKPFAVRIAALLLCAFACVYQLAFFTISQNAYSDFDSIESSTVSEREFSELTKDRKQKNNKFYSDPNSEWNADYDVFCFLSNN